MPTINLRIKDESGKPTLYRAEVLWTNDKFATHSAHGNQGYGATHIASGDSVSLVMPTEAHARVFAQWLSGLDCDWSAKKPDFSEVPKCLIALREWLRKLPKAPTLNTVKIKARALSGLRITRLPGA